MVTWLFSFDFELPFPRRDRGTGLQGIILVVGNGDTGLRLEIH